MKVLGCLEAAGLKLVLDKCHFSQMTVKYMGHIVSANSVSMDPDKLRQSYSAIT